MKKLALLFVILLAGVVLFMGCMTGHMLPSTSTTVTSISTTTVSTVGSTTSTTIVAATTTTTTTGMTTTTLTGLEYSTREPSSVVKICFIHHSCGDNWLSSSNGGLGTALNNNNYYVTETNYGWDAEAGDNLGDRTDTPDWPSWFNGTKMPYVYADNSHYAYTNVISDPGGENDIIMFKSCFPNSEVGGGIDDEKAIYNSLLSYFAAHTDKLFILITPPGETVVSSYVLTKQLCDWLVDEQNGWLAGYTGRNVAVFDFYGVLSETDSHHRIFNNGIQHVYSPSYDGTSPYHDSGNDHPNATGNQKATAEYLPLLNYFYNRWKGIAP